MGIIYTINGKKGEDYLQTMAIIIIINLCDDASVNVLTGFDTCSAPGEQSSPQEPNTGSKLRLMSPCEKHVKTVKYSYKVTIKPRYGDGSKPWYLVNPKIAGKWMFIPLKMYLQYRY